VADGADQERQRPSQPVEFERASDICCSSPGGRTSICDPRLTTGHSVELPCDGPSPRRSQVLTRSTAGWRGTKRLLGGVMHLSVHRSRASKASRKQGSMGRSKPGCRPYSASKWLPPSTSKRVSARRGTSLLVRATPVAADRPSARSGARPRRAKTPWITCSAWGEARTTLVEGETQLTKPGVGLGSASTAGARPKSATRRHSAARGYLDSTRRCQAPTTTPTPRPSSTRRPRQPQAGRRDVHQYCRLRHR
jgi:hypothetical protein